MDTDVLSTHSAIPHIDYEVVVGLDVALTLAVSEQWSETRNNLFTEMLKANPNLFNDPKDIANTLTEYGLTDFHWNWLAKATQFNTDEYIWLYLTTGNGRVQAVALIYHPKESRVDQENIFYVDYIATAYWNRPYPGSPGREFSGAARILIASAISHCQTTFGYRAGFSLHSLPTAESYYQSLGMIAFEKDPLKENLRYFEADSATSLKIAGSAP